MHVALIANTAWLDEEMNALRHLVVGLIGEQVRVAQVVPESIHDDAISDFGERVSWLDTSWDWLRRRRLVHLAEHLAELGVDIVHALDGRLWSAARGLAQRLDAAAVLTAGSAVDVEQVATAGAGRSGHAAPGVGYAAATPSIQQALAERLRGTAVVEHIPPGVHLGKRPTGEPTARSALCAVVTGTGRHDEDYDALLDAISHVAATRAEAQFFFDSQGDDNQLWEAAKQRDLLGHISLVPRKLGHRELLLKADVLIQPQALGRPRGLILQAMANGVPVCARRDAWVDYLKHDETAWLVDQPNADDWRAVIERLYDQPAFALALAQRAYDWVGQHHLASQQVTRCVNLYRRLTGEGMKFPGNDAS